MVQESTQNQPCNQSKHFMIVIKFLLKKSTIIHVLEHNAASNMNICKVKTND